VVMVVQRVVQLARVPAECRELAAAAAHLPRVVRPWWRQAVAGQPSHGAALS
jgi:hypothetical protein